MRERWTPSRYSSARKVSAPGVSRYSATGAAAPVRRNARNIVPFVTETSTRPSAQACDANGGRASVRSSVARSGRAEVPFALRPRPKRSSMQPSSPDIFPNWSQDEHSHAQSTISKSKSLKPQWCSESVRRRVSVPGVTFSSVTSSFQLPASPERTG